jgi:hypothetical protein
MAAILVGGLECRTQFWKWTTQGSLLQSLKLNQRRRFFFISSPLFSIVSLAAILIGNRDHRAPFWRGTPKDHSTKVWLQLTQWFLKKILKCEMLKDRRWTKSDDNSSHGLKAR